MQEKHTLPFFVMVDVARRVKELVHFAVFSFDAARPLFRKIERFSGRRGWGFAPSGAGALRRASGGEGLRSPPPAPGALPLDPFLSRPLIISGSR